MFKRIKERSNAKKQEKIHKSELKRSGNKLTEGNSTKYEFRSNGKYDVEINKNLITITNKGVQNFTTKGAVGTKTIKIENISAVQLKEYGKLTGYIQFVLIGSQEVKGGALAAVKDENSITFGTSIEQEWAKEIKSYVETYSAPSVGSISVADEILKFKQLFDDGIINETEFNIKKKELLGI